MASYCTFRAYISFRETTADSCVKDHIQFLRNLLRLPPLLYGFRTPQKDYGACAWNSGEDAIYRRRMSVAQNTSCQAVWNKIHHISIKHNTVHSLLYRTNVRGVKPTFGVRVRSTVVDCVNSLFIRSHSLHTTGSRTSCVEGVTATNRQTESVKPTQRNRHTIL